MKIKNLWVLLSFFLLFSISCYSSSFIIKFKDLESKQRFVPLIEKTYNSLIEELPTTKVIENILKKKGQDFTQESQELLVNLQKYSIIKVSDNFTEHKLSYDLKQYGVEFVELNFKVTLKSLDIQDELFKEQWYLDAINIPLAWENAKGNGIRVGIVDTGLDIYHKDFVDRIWINPFEDNNKNGTFEPWSDTLELNGIFGDLNGIDDDGNGFVDDVIGYDFVNQVVGNFGDFVEPDPIPEDEHSHGTLVAGVICAGLNGTGIVGVAPSAKIVVLRAFDVTGNAEIKDIASAIVYAGLTKVNVLNLSFGTNYDSNLLKEAIKFASKMGCIIIASAGNDGKIIEHFPSDYPEVLSVGATTKNGFIAKSSNYGKRIDIFAPGYEIVTTTLEGGYKTVSGTSFSSPIVSGIVALLLEINPSLQTSEIKSILKSTQTPLQKDKRSYNQGLVNAGDAVKFLGTSKVEIAYPYEFEEISKSKINQLKVMFSVYSPFFDSFDLNLFVNDTILKKSLLIKQQSQRIIDSTFLDLHDIEPGSYSLVLSMNLKNGNRFNVVRKIFVYDSNNKLVILDSKIINTIYETKNLPLYVSITNIPTFCIVYSYNGHSLVGKYSDNLYAKQHNVPIVLKTSQLPFQRLLIIVEHRTKSGVILYDTLVANNYIEQVQRPINKKYNTLPISYVFPQMIKFKQINEFGLLINPYNNLEWGNLQYYIFKDSIFIKKSEYSKPFVATDIGNSNGNEFDEIITTSFGRTVIFEPESGDNFFKNVLFESGLNETLWASGFCDLDGDGFDEIICNNNSSILIYKFSLSKYILKYQITPLDTFGSVGTKPGVQIGDFDNDGNFELSFFTTSGYLLIYQYNPQDYRFNLEFFYKLDVDPFSISSCISNFSGTEKPVLCFTAGVNTMTEDFWYEYSTIWKFFTLRSKGFNLYEIKEEMNFWGARIGATPQGFFYRNGMASGNADYQLGDEIFLSLFPNLYVLKYDKNADKFIAILWLPFVYSNSVVIGDFDQNGVNEFGVSRWDGLNFFEFSSSNNLEIPKNADGWVNLNDTIFIKWDKVSNANLYQIFELDKYTNLLNFVGSTSNDFFAIRRSYIFGERTFFVKGIDTIGNFNPSYFSNPVFIFETTLTKPLKAYALNDNQILVCFEGKLSESNIPFKESVMIQEFGDTLQIASMIKSNDTSLIITTFEGFEYGKYLVFLDSFRDYWGNYTQPKSLEFFVEFVNKGSTVLTYERLNFIDRNSLEIVFPMPLDINSALDLGNYKIKPFGVIQDVKLKNENTISLVISKEPNIFSLGLDFYLILGQIYSKDKSKFVQPPYNTIAITRQAEGIEDAFAYPNPLNLNYSYEITFANLPSDSKVEIFDSHLTKILEVENLRLLGGVSVDLQNSNHKILPGIYYFRVTKLENGSWITSSLKKFAIVK